MRSFAPSSSTFRFPKPPLCRLSRSIIDSQRHLHFPPPNFPLPAVATLSLFRPPSIYPSSKEISRSPRPRYPSQNQCEAGKRRNLFCELSGLSLRFFVCPFSFSSPFPTFSSAVSARMDVALRSFRKFDPREPQHADIRQPGLSPAANSKSNVLWQMLEDDARKSGPFIRHEMLITISISLQVGE